MARNVTFQVKNPVVRSSRLTHLSGRTGGFEEVPTIRARIPSSKTARSPLVNIPRVVSPGIGAFVARIDR